MTRLGWRPACASAGKNKSGRVRHQTIGPFVRAAIPAANRAAAAPSTVPDPPPANSCRAPWASPPPGRIASISATPNGRQPAFLAPSPSMEEMRSRRSARTWARTADIGRGILPVRGGWKERHHAARPLYVLYLFRYQRGVKRAKIGIQSHSFSRSADSPIGIMSLWTAFETERYGRKNFWTLCKLTSQGRRR